MDSKTRLTYIDCLRGICMILVIHHHLLCFCYGDDCYISALDSFVVTVRMPLFFFITGFVSARMIESFSDYRRRISKKIVGQFIPTIPFFILYCFYRNIDPLEVLASPLKLGYWFTYVSFAVFFIYTTVALAFHKYVRNMHEGGDSAPLYSAS